MDHLWNEPLHLLDRPRREKRSGWKWAERLNPPAVNPTMEEPYLGNRHLKKDGLLSTRLDQNQLKLRPQNL
jgi:hypothetical protein